MFKHFLTLEWKSFFRSSNLGKGIAIKVMMIFLAIYLMISMLSVGAGAYFLLEKVFPNVDPLVSLSKYMIYWVLFELLFRYFMQKLPVMNIKPLLTLPVSKQKIAHYVLAKSGLSYFNFLTLFALVPFAIVLCFQGYHIVSVLLWVVSVMGIILSINYVNFLINKSDKFFVAILLAIAGLFGLEYFKVAPITDYAGKLFYAFYSQPYLVVIPLTLAILAYAINYKLLRNKIFLDASLAKKTKEAEASELGWTRRFGDMAPFLQLDLKLIWRNKRTKTQVFVSLLMILYGLIFYKIPTYADMDIMKVFVGVFMTGIFVTNFGQFIPAWDSAYYSMMMSQNIPLRKYLESKYLLLSISVVFMFLLTIPYVYFGIDALLINAACALYNLGICLPIVLFFGSFNKKRIDLTKSALGNMQGASATQFLIMLPAFGVPMIIYAILSFFISSEVALGTIAAMGLLGFAFRKPILDRITTLFREKKHGMIAGFKEANN